MWHDLSLISLALVTEDTWTEAENAWVFVVKLGGMGGGGGGCSFFFKKLFLVMLPAYTLKSSHDSTIDGFYLVG